MMDDLCARLRQMVQASIHHLDQAVDKLEKDAPHYGPGFLFRETRGALEVLRASYDAVITNYLENTPEEFIAKSQVHLSLVRWLHSDMLPYLEEVDTDIVPVEMQLSMTALAHTLLEDSFTCALAFYPTQVVDYEVHGWKNLAQAFYEKLEHTLPGSFPVEMLDAKDRPDWSVILQYPRMEVGNGLLHVNLVHEIAHLVEKSKKLADGLMGAIKTDPSRTRTVVEETLKSGDIVDVLVKAGSNREDLEQKALGSYAKLLENWLREVCCDLIAVCLSGPAYFFGFVEESLLANVMEKGTLTHPPSAARLGWVLGELERGGFMENTEYCCEFIRKELTNWQGILGTYTEVEGSLSFQLAHETIQENIEIVGEHVRKAIPGGLVFQAKRMKDVETRARETFARGLAISDRWAQKDAESSQPVDRMELFNAAWIAYLAFRQDLLAEITVSEDGLERELLARRTLDALLLNALERSEILSQWGKI